MKVFKNPKNQKTKYNGFINEKIGYLNKFNIPSSFDKRSIKTESTNFNTNSNIQTSCISSNRKKNSFNKNYSTLDTNKNKHNYKKKYYNIKINKNKPILSNNTIQIFENLKKVKKINNEKKKFISNEKNNNLNKTENNLKNNKKRFQIQKKNYQITKEK